MGYITINQFNKSLDNISKKTLYTNNNCKANLDNLKKIPTDCSKFSFTDFMELLNYQSPTLTFTINPNTTIYEKGTNVTTLGLNATVVKGTDDLLKLSFYKDSTLLNEVSSDQLKSSNSFNYVYSTSFNSDTTFKVILTTSTNETVEKSIVINFYNPYFYGVVSNKDNVDISSLTKVLSKKENKKLSYTANNEYCVFAIPNEYNLTKIIDMNNFDNTKSFNLVNKDVDINGTTTSYKVYVTNNPVTCTNFSYTFYVS